MQEVFELMIKDALDAAEHDKMLMDIDGIALLKHIKLERALAENNRLRAERYLIEHVRDDNEEFVEDELVREACDFSRIVETMDWVIDLMESGRFSKEK